MKKTLTPLHRSGGRSRTGRWFKQALASAALLIAAAGAQAQISINLGVNPTIDFTATPTAAQWATFDITTGAANTYGSPAALDTGAQTIDASVVTTALPTTAANGTARLTRHNTAGGYLVTQPTGVPTAVLMARLQNNSGGDLNVLSISYSYTIPVAPVTDNVPGQRVFWSLTGTPNANSWNLIPSLSGVTTAGTLNANIGVGPWPNGTTLYLLWLDDNNETGADGAFAIDNVVFTAEVLGPISIVSSPTNLTVAERSPASFTVVATGSPQEFHWLRGGVPIPGAHSATYTIASASVSDSGAVFSCIVSNSANSQTSAGATLTVTPDTTAPTAIVANASTNTFDIVVTFSEPVAVQDASNFVLYEVGQDPQASGISGSSLVVNGNIVTVTMGSALADGVNYLLDIYDVTDTAATPNTVFPYPTTLPVRRDLLLIDFDGPNNEWKYSTETNLFEVDPTWAAASYDDSGVTWLSGPAALGVNTDVNLNAVPIRTATAYTPNSAPQFFRKHFFLPASAVGSTLSIRHLFEDGGVVYINGQEAGRYNVPAGALSATTRATANFTEGTATVPPPLQTAPLPSTNLVAGDNVIAVVVVQSGATSSDSIMALELVANIGTYAAGPPSIVTPPASQTITEGGSVTFSVVANGALPLTYHWRKGVTPISGAHAPSYTITGVLPSDAGNYNVIVSNSISTATSANALLTVTADTTAPAFVSAAGPTNADTVVVTFYDAGGFNLADLQDTSKYSIGLTAGGGALTISSAVAAASGTNMVVTITTTTPRLANQNYTVSTTVKDRSAAQNPVTPSSRGVVAHIILFGFNQVWRYDQTGNDLGSTWKDVGYPDGSWLSGAGFLAFENSAGPLTLFTNLAGGSGTNTSLVLTNQTLSGISGTNITYYFRTTFGNLPFNPNAAGNSLQAVSYFDDGGVIYVNGSEQVRFNYTNSPVALNYTNFAIAGSTEGAGGLVTSNLLGFVQANNVIAAEVHQNALGSSDIAWGMQLEAFVTTFVPPGPTLHIVDNGNGTVTLTWTGSGTLRSTSDPTTPIGSWAVVPGSPVSGYTPSSAGGPKFYVLTQ